MKTGEVAARYGLAVIDVHRIARRISVPRDSSGALAWNDDALTALQSALERREIRRAFPPGRSGPEVAASLGIPYSRLMNIVRLHSIKIEKRGQLYLWSDSAIGAVQEIVAAEKNRPPLPGRSTKEVARALGFGHKSFLAFLRGVRHLVNPRRIGTGLRWEDGDVEALRRHLATARGDRANAEAAREIRTLSKVRRIERIARSILDLVGGRAAGAPKPEPTLAKYAAEIIELAAQVAEARSTLTVCLNILPSRDLVLTRPLSVLMRALDAGFEAEVPGLDLVAEGRTRREALSLCSRLLVEKFWATDSSPEARAQLQQLIRPIAPAPGPKQKEETR